MSVSSTFGRDVSHKRRFHLVALGQHKFLGIITILAHQAVGSSIFLMTPMDVIRSSSCLIVSVVWGHVRG